MPKKMSFEERARVAGQARVAAMKPEEHSALARQAAAKANSPASRARSIVRAWPTMSRVERNEVLDILRAGGVIKDG